MKLIDVRVDELGTVITGKTPSTKNPAFFDGEFPFVTPSDIEYSHYYVRQTETKVTEEAKAKHKNQFLPPDSILFTCIGNTLGKCAISAECCLTNQQLNSIVPFNSAHAKFIYYLLLQNITIFRGIGIGGGAATPIINKSKFCSVALKAPPKDRWADIGNILSAYDDLIENNKRRMQLLEEAARQLYREWFVRLRFPGHEHTRIVDGLPEGWERKPLGEVCSAIKETVQPKDVEPETPYIGLEHIPRRSISLSEWGSAEAVTSTKYKFCEGDILFGKIRPYFHKVGIAFVSGITSSDAIVVRADQSSHQALLLCLMSSDEFVADTAQSMREGSKMPRADWKLMQQYPVLLPKALLLEEFTEVIENTVQQLKTLTLQNQKLRAARDLLLPKLMNGEIAV